MDWFVEFQDPLAAMAAVPEHPIFDEDTILRGFQSSLPPVSPLATLETDRPSSQGIAEDAALGQAARILAEYLPACLPDDTSRVLRAFLDHLPSQGKSVLASEICQLASSPPKLRQLRNFMVDAILKPMRLAGGRNPPIPIQPMAIQTGPEEDIAVTMARIRLSFRGTKQAEMRHDCMRRDGNRCVVTGVFDNDHLKTLPQQIRQGKPGGSLECAYILPFGLTILNEANGLEVRKKGAVWWALYRYFPNLGNDRIGPSSINKRQNGLMVDTGIRHDLGEFRVALEPLGQQKYTLRVFDDTPMGSRIPSAIQLSQSLLGTSVPLPDPEVLGAHFAIAAIMSQSGIGPRMDETLGDINGMIEFPGEVEPNGTTDLGHLIIRKLLLDV